jgi:pyruvate/2-oxoglutarate dehydrogenase complex dihydrolipoamide acyltransferase (E2) component
MGMVTPVKAPHVGMTAVESTLVRWLKKEGEAVSCGEALAEIEMDKATVEVQCDVQGSLLRVVVAEGTQVHPGEVIGYIGDRGEAVPE